MPDKPDNQFKFWQELKRRKVIRVITVYAAAAFVILELTDIVAPSLGLPSWTLNFIIILLCAGFIIAVIISWIYDIHPEGRIIKTEPASKAKNDEKTTHSKGWRIASYTSFVIILVLLFFQFAGIRDRNPAQPNIKKAIAVLPFDNMSNDPEQKYFSDGITDDILNHLSKIAALSVKSRTSTLQYKGSTIPIPQIGDELGVDVILEGSVRKEGNKLRIVAQLIDVKTDSHLWSETFDKEITSIFSVQSQIAIEIANILEATLTEEEKKNINKEASIDITAYDYYLKARQMWDNWDSGDKELDNILQLYKQAIDLDPDFALGYYGIGRTLHYGKRYYGAPQEIWIDSAFALAEKAIRLDPSLPEGYILRSAIYGEPLGKKSESDEDLLKAYELAPNNPDVLYLLGEYYLDQAEYKKGASMRVKSVQLRYTKKDPEYLRYWGLVYEFIGDFEKAELLLMQAIKLDPGTNISSSLASLYMYSMGKYSEAIEIYEELFERNENGQGSNDRLGWANLLAGNLDRAEMHWSKYLEIDLNYDDTSQYVPFRHRLAYVKWLKGEKDEAMSLFQEQMKLDKETLKGLRGHGAWNFKSYYYDLGVVNAFLGNKEDAYMMLDSAAKYGLFGLLIIDIDPLLDGIRNEERFQKMLNKEREITSLRRDAYKEIVHEYEAQGHLKWFFEQE